MPSLHSRAFLCGMVAAALTGGWIVSLALANALWESTCTFLGEGAELTSECTSVCLIRKTHFLAKKSLFERSRDSFRQSIL